MLTMSCPLCGAICCQIRFSASIGKSSCCRQCGGIVNDCMADDEVYSSAYYSNNYAAIETQQQDRFMRILNSVDALVTTHRVLDVGCGTGMLLRVAYMRGYRNSVGIDCSVDAVKIAQHKLADTDVSILPSGDPITGQFGVITFMDSIAHIANLHTQFPAIIAERLLAGGVLIVRTPRYSKAYFCYGMVVGWVLRLLGKSDLAARQIFHMPARQYLFSEKALQAFLARHGFVNMRTTLEAEYAKDKGKVRGVKRRVVRMFLRGIPDLLRGKKQSILCVAQKS